MISPVRLSLRLLLLFVVLVGLVARAAGRPAAVSASGVRRYAGWAMDAYPDMSADAMVAAMTRMHDAGANLVWIGQSNPVTVDPNAREIALSYAVYAASINPADPQHAAAQAIIAAQRRALDAARATGMAVVLPIGYQTQMGRAWSNAHPGSLRLGPDGQPINLGGIDASPYSSRFRADTVRYDQWIEQQFVAPYRDVLLMVMLSDEPTGVDYSAPADAAFAARTGYHFADVGNDPNRIAQLGHFQAHVMDDYAIWAAQQWLTIDPGLTVNITFDGTPARKSEQAPDIRPIFRDAPSNLQPGWDANIENGPPTVPLNDSDVTSLALLAGTLANYSARYHRPYWLWSAGNSWGLAQGSSDPSSVADALVNLHLLADTSREAGGDLRGIAIWNYNVRGQGLYNDGYHPAYQTDNLFMRLTTALPAIRRILAGPAGPGPNALVFAPNALPERLLASDHVVNIFKFRGYNFGDLVSLVRAGVTPAVVTTLGGADLARARIVVVLARDPRDISPADAAALRHYRAGGGIIVDASTVDGTLGLQAQWVYPGNAPEQFFADAYTKQQTGPVAALGMPHLTNSFTVVGPSEFLAYGGTSFDPPDQMRAWVTVSNAVEVRQYHPDGNQTATSVVGPGLVAIPTQRHAFSLLAFDPAAPPELHDDQYFQQTGYRIDDNTIWNYFTHRGGVRTFGYPTSRTVTLLGFRTQFFQRAVVQVAADGSPRTLNLLDSGLLPYSSFNNSLFPAPDPALTATAPTPDNPSYAQLAVAWTLAHAPDTWQGLPVNFGTTFLQTVTLADAYPTGGGDPALVPLLNLELWGLPTSAPAYDPTNDNFVYLRFQRGIMHYDIGCGCTQGILLADYLKALLLNRNVPSDLAAEAQASPYFGQYDPTAPGWVSRPALLPGTDLTDGFERG